MRIQGALLGLLSATGIAFLCLSANSQTQTEPNERDVKSQPSKLDKPGVWAMDFRFKDPRILKLKLPARGERYVWYLWFQVINRSGKPQEISPYFELVTLDNPGVYRDEILLTAEEEIKKREDKSGYSDIKNTVSISKFAIPTSKPVDEAFPRPVTGVAIWDAGPVDPAKRDQKHKELSETTRFSIFIRGLSNGFVEVDSPFPTDRPITQYKTLQLNFKRKGDPNSDDSRNIEFVSPAQWIYRSATRTIPTDKKDEKKVEPEKK
jgi:hypothetical protein